MNLWWLWKKSMADKWKSGRKWPKSKLHSIIISHQPKFENRRDEILDISQCTAAVQMASEFFCVYFRLSQDRKWANFFHWHLLLVRIVVNAKRTLSQKYATSKRFKSIVFALVMVQISTVDACCVQRRQDRCSAPNWTSATVIGRIYKCMLSTSSACSWHVCPRLWPIFDYGLEWWWPSSIN